MVRTSPTASPFSLVTTFKAENDLIYFKVLYVNIWPRLDFRITIIVYLENLIIFFIKATTARNIRQLTSVVQSVTWGLYWVMDLSFWGLIRPLRTRNFRICLFKTPPDHPWGADLAFTGLFIAVFSERSETACTGYSRFQSSITCVRYDRLNLISQF